MKNAVPGNSFSRNQVWGILILILLVLLLIIGWRLLPLFRNPQTAYPDKTLTKKWQQQDSSPVRSADYPEKEDYYEQSGNPAASATLFAFDPNTASENDFVRLGLSPKVAHTILNYRNKGGKFYQKEDFAKIYTLREEDFKRLLPYIHIAGGGKPIYNRSGYTPHYNDRKGNYSPYPAKTNEPVQINNCTPEQLMALRGIGTGYASRILKYRDILGGYVRVEQLKEVYGMNDSLYEAIKDLINIQPELVRKININTATEEEFRQHPYTRNMAKYIIVYRKDIGQFKRIEEFRQVPLINEEKYRKIAPYLSL